MTRTQERYLPRDFGALDLYAEDHPELADDAAATAAEEPRHYYRIYYGILRYAMEKWG